MSWFLETIDAEGNTHRHALDADCVTIGRSSSADIHLPQAYVSRRHVQLLRQGSGWLLKDLGSRGGTKVNGEQADEQPIKHGDLIDISLMRLKLIEENLEDEGAYIQNTTMHWAAEAQPPDISTLHQGASPKLDWRQISDIDSFGRELLLEKSPSQRLQSLCDAVAGRIIKANWAVLLEVPNDDTPKQPEIVTASPEGINDFRKVHISSTTLQALKKHGAPVLANNFTDSNNAVEMSIVDGAAASAVAAYPLDDAQQKPRVLYVNLPPSLGTTEWLAVISLVAKTYQQSEAIWRERQAVQQRAVMERDLDNARSIQRSILPEPVEFAGLDIAWSFLPCDAVGGDYVDVVRLPENRVLIAIADVSGHGLAAALATLSIHSVLQTCMKSGMTGKEMMMMLDAHLHQYLPTGRFASMLIVIIDLETGQTECVSAGHEPPEIVSKSGSTRTLAHGDEMILGVQPSEMSAQFDQLHPGETMILYTDGLSELKGSTGKMLRTEGVVELLTELHDQSPDSAGVTTDIRKRLDAIQGTAPRLDDQSFMLVKKV